MIEEHKQLLLKDLCAKLPYGVKCIVNGLDDCTLMPSDIEEEGEIKPYLRPMSSMTEEEKKVYKEFSSHLCGQIVAYHLLDYLNAHHLDYRGLIPMGLAIEVTEQNNPYK